MYKIYPNKIKVGCRVLFVYNSIAFTGVVKCIGEKSYGILCDSDHFTTDAFHIPRQFDVVYIPIENCVKTGEVYPICYKNKNINPSYRFANVLEAEKMLPKYTIEQPNPITFIPNRHLFKLDDDRIYTYKKGTYLYLQDIENPENIIYPIWKYQRIELSINTSDNTIDEDNIIEIYEIPAIYRYLPYTVAFKDKLYDVIYRKPTSPVSIVHYEYPTYDTNINELPDTILYNDKMFLKRDNLE